MLDMNHRLLPSYLPHAVALTLLGLSIVLWSTEHRLAPVYYGLMTILGVLLLGGNRWRRIQAYLQSIAGPVAIKVIVLGYAAVIAEETLVGTLYALNEGFTLPVWFERVKQFISFNLFAFTGAILGLGLAYAFWPGLKSWHFWIAGTWGLFAEGTVFFVLSNPIAAMLVAPANMAVYSIILAPLMLALPSAQADVKRWQIPATWVIMFCLSLAPVAVLQYLRSEHPGAFPKCDYIEC